MNLRYPLCAAMLSALAYLQPYRPFVVDGDSMSPTLVTGEWVVGVARPTRLSRGDVVVFRHGAETMIKRVAYLPGDRIERYFVVHQWVVPPNPYMRASLVRRGLPRHDLIVPQGHLFVVGDNYPVSFDSRSFGSIDEGEVLALLPKAAPFADGWYAPSHLTKSMVAVL